ncbi:hypothetical protein, partial [Cloacibacterium sp.]|uniref:hypothetical protein n=1 Tax=Cloacibacterium sp. TaxID=1913682 RepID=UPI00352BDA02
NAALSRRRSRVRVPSGSQLFNQNSSKRFKTYVLKRFLFYVCSKRDKKSQSESDLFSDLLKQV